MPNYNIEWISFEGNYYNENDLKKNFPCKINSTTCPHCLKYISVCGKSADVKFCPFCGTTL